MAAEWGGPEFRAERQAFADWLGERLRAAEAPDDVRQDVIDRIIQPKEEREMGTTYTEWAEGHRQRGREEGIERGIERGRAEGREEGRAEGRAILLRQALRRFGAEVAGQLEERLRSMGAEQLALVGDAVVECDTADELLAAAGHGATERH